MWIGGSVGTPGNAVLTRRTFGREEFEDVAAWLDDEARRLFPESTHARNLGQSELIPHIESPWRSETWPTTRRSAEARIVTVST